MSCKPLLSAFCAVWICAIASCVSASEVVVTEDFDFGVWSPFLSRWQKSVPVCIWDADGSQSLFRVEATGLVSNRLFRLQNDIGERVAYRLHWGGSSNTSQREKLSPNIPTNRVYQSSDTHRCATGPSGMLRLTINPKALANAPPGLYSDTIILTITPL